MWKALGVEGQQKYQDAYKAGKEQYEKDFAAFKETDEYKKYEKTLNKNRNAKKEGDKLAKNGGVKKESSKKRSAMKSAGGPAAKKQKGEEGAADAEGAEVEEDDDDIVFDSDEEAGEGEGAEEEA